MNIELKPGERLDDLQRNGYKIIQDPGRFCFGMDAVLLSGFAKVKEGEKVLDIGTGTGIIPILLAAKTPGQHFTGLEIQPESADMARRSVALNHLEEKISIVEGDVREADLREVSVTSWLSLLYLVSFGSLLAYSAYVWLLKVRPAAEVGTHAYVNPFIAVLLGVFLGNERVTFIQLSGLLVILLGVMLISRKRLTGKTGNL